MRPYVDEWEAAGHFPDSLFRRCGELGFLGLHYPAAWGGSDGDLAAGIVFVEELARCGRGGDRDGDLGAVPHGDAGARASSAPTTQRERWLAPAIAGEKIGAIAITEPDAGSDVAAIRTRAVRDGDVWRVNGTKMFITNGTRARLPHARRAQTDAAASGHRGICLFIVDTVAPRRVGVAQARQARHVVAATPPRSRSTTCAVPADELIGGRTRPRASRS